MSVPPLPSSRILALAYLAALAFAFCFQVVPPLVGMLVSDFGLTHGEAGLLMGLFTLPGILLALPGGALADRIGHGRVALFSLALMTAGTLLMLPGALWALFAGRFLAGAGAAVLVTVVPPIIARFFTGPRAGVAMGVYNTAMPVGTLVSFNLLGALALDVGLPLVFAAVAGLCALTFLAFLLAYREHPGEGEARELLRATPMRAAFSLRGLGAGLWILALAWALYNIAVLGFFTFGADYLAREGYSPAAANLLAGLPMLFALPLVPLAGWLARTPAGKGWAILAGCLVPALAIVLFLADPARAAWWAVVMGVGVGIIPPAVFTLVPVLVPPGRVATGFGVLNGTFNLFIFLGIPAAGALRDATGSYAAPFLCLAATGAAGGAVSLLLKWRGHLR
jgi:cyanate permease